MTVKTSDKNSNSGLPGLLLVEDSRTTKVLLSRELVRHYTLYDASNGEEAWQLLQNHPEIEVVITDIQMPVLNGHELLQRIRESRDTHLKNMPVIVMTGADDIDAKSRAFANGANDFLTKPVEILELQARVNVHRKLAGTIRELEKNRAQMAELASTDPLTKIKNRRSFQEIGAHQIAMANRYNTDISVLMLDIDHFKSINDNCGHQAGDEVLVMFANIVAETIRNVDIVARIGGEEFALLLPGTNRLGAAVLAERIREKIETQRFDTVCGPLAVTVSIGLSSLATDLSESIDDLLAVADKRLYLAKKNGRNRICVNDQGKSTFRS